MSRPAPPDHRLTNWPGCAPPHHLVCGCHLGTLTSSLACWSAKCLSKGNTNTVITQTNWTRNMRKNLFCHEYEASSVTWANARWWKLIYASIRPQLWDKQCKVQGACLENFPLGHFWKLRTELKTIFFFNSYINIFEQFLLKNFELP